MTDPILDDELDDFSDLDSIIADAETERAAKRGIAAKRSKLSTNLSDDERLKLTAEVRRHEDTYVWQTVAAVALFHSQHCASCDHTHRFFMGWMTLQQHRTDPNCRRYCRGRAEAVETRIETHAQADVEMCADCAEAQLEIEQIVRAVNHDIEQKQVAATLAAHRERQEAARLAQGVQDAS